MPLLNLHFVAAELGDLDTLHAARCKWGNRGLGALVTMSNPRMQRNPALYLPFPKKTPVKEIMRTSLKNANNFL
jgi:hypothetical protein